MCARVPPVQRENVPLRSVAIFYVLAFSLSWLIEILQVAAARGLIHLQLPGAIGFLSPLAPMLAAGLMSVREGGMRGLRHLLGRLLRWRVAPAWYVAVLARFPVLGLVAVSLAYAVSGRTPDFSANYIRSVFPQFPQNLSPWLLVLPFLLYSILTTIPEEVGWRGFALPRMQERWGAVYASLAVGALWGLWHLPDFFYPQAVQSGISFPLFLAGTLSTSILFTWVFNGTAGSLLMVSVLHSSFNATDVFLPLLPQVTGTTLQLWLWVAVITLVAVTLAMARRLRDAVRRVRRVEQRQDEV
ncbi:MAG: CPBP family intramembrane glutamic endopeptidase [Candidatus Dormibacter sp.]